MRAGNGPPCTVPIFRKFVDDSTARVTQSHHLGNFVVSLSCRVVTGAAEIGVVTDILNTIEQGMTS